MILRRDGVIDTSSRVFFAVSFTAPFNDPLAFATTYAGEPSTLVFSSTPTDIPILLRLKTAIAGLYGSAAA